MIEDDIVQWCVLLGKGAVPHVALNHCALYVCWLFDLEGAIYHITYDELALAFQEVTGHQARYVDTDLRIYWESGPLAGREDFPAGYNASVEEPATMLICDNFTEFWNLWRASGGNIGVVRQDYDLLREMHPDGVRSPKKLMMKEEEQCKQQGEKVLVGRLEADNPMLRLLEETAIRRLRVHNASTEWPNPIHHRYKFSLCLEKSIYYYHACHL